MKKRLTSLLLAMCMMFAAATSVRAVDTDPPLWQQIGSESKAAFCDDWGYYLRAERSGEPLSDVEYDELATIFAQKLTYIKTGSYCHDEGYDSLEELLAEEYGFQQGDRDRDEILASLAWDMTLREWQDLQRQRSIQRERAALGLPATGIGVLLNDRAIVFDGALPEYANAATYVPVRQTAQALGATVGYAEDTQAVTVAKAGLTLSFPIGGTTMTTEGAETDRATLLPAPVYEKNGASYIPVRAFAEALGYDVLWDEEYETAILLDSTAIKAELDKGLDTINRVFALYEPEETGKAYRTVWSVVGTLTAFDSISGNKQYPVNADMTIITQGQNFSLDLQFDMKGLYVWLQKLSGYEPDEEDEYDALMSKVLTDAELQIIADLDQDILYLRSPTVAGLLIGLEEQSAIPGGAAALSQNAWYKIEGAGLPDMLQMLGDDPLTAAKNAIAGEKSMGALAYGLALAQAQQQVTGNLTFYDTLRESVADIRRVCGDDRFTKSGGSATLTIDSEKLDTGDGDEWLRALLAQEDIKSLKLSLTVGENGETSGTVRVHQTPYYAQETLTSIAFRLASHSAEGTVTYHIKNKSEAAFTIQMTSQEQAGDMVLAPPEGALVIDLGALLGI